MTLPRDIRGQSPLTSPACGPTIFPSITSNARERMDLGCNRGRCAMQNAIGRFVIVLALAVGAMPPVAGFAQAPSPESRPATLPPETMQAFQQAYPDATITTTLRDRLDGRTVFIVDSVD